MFLEFLWLHINFRGLLVGSDSKDSACNEGDLAVIPWSARSPGKVNGNPLYYSCLRNLMKREAWCARVHGVARVRHDLGLLVLVL